MASKQFKLTELPTATFLSVRGLRFLGCESISEKQARFVFDDPQDIGWQLVAEFQNNGECSAQAFYRHFCVLRSAAKQAVVMRTAGGAR